GAALTSDRLGQSAARLASLRTRLTASVPIHDTSPDATRGHEGRANVSREDGALTLPTETIAGGRPSIMKSEKKGEPSPSGLRLPLARRAEIISRTSTAAQHATRRRPRGLPVLEHRRPVHHDVPDAFGQAPAPCVRRAI